MILANKEKVEKTILTLHGYVKYKRTLLVPADNDNKQKLLELTGQRSVCPIDDLLGVSNLPFKITCQMMAHIAEEATIAHSYTEATNIIIKEIEAPISVSTVKEVTDYVGSIMYQLQVKEAKEAEKLLPDRKIDKRRIRKSDDDILYIETDGAMGHVRDKEHVGLEEDEIEKDTSKAHQAGWTEFKHAICFHARAIKYYYEDNTGKRCSGRFANILRLKNIKILGHTIEARDCIGGISTSEHFQYYLLVLAERNDWRHCSKIVLLSDGAKWIKTIKDNIFKGREVIQILDLYHAKENAGKFANWAKRGKRQKKKYADYLCSMIENGKANELLKELEPYKDVKTPLGVPNLYTYISNNKDYMDYPRYKAEGLFVGSGAMESANIYMMQDRMKLPGMRWSVTKGRHMLCLKSYYASRNWSNVEQYIKTYHKQYNV